MYDFFSEDLLLPTGGSVPVEFNGLADCPSNSYDGWGDGSIEIISDIVVNGVRSPTSAFWNGSIIYEDCEAWGNFWAVWEDHMYDGYQENDSYFTDRLPSNFDKELDAKIDQVARGIKEIINSKPDLKTNEYVAIIWKDSHGDIKSTSLERGSDRSPPINNVWAQVDFAGGGLIVAIVHSHPTMYNAGSLDQPDWQPRAQGGTLSSIDFDQLIDYSKGRDGFDSPNYRSYLVYEGNLNEYHAFDQNKAFYGFGGQATWAVKSD